MTIIIYIISGLLAGVATGLVGLSAAAIIVPIFTTILKMDAYQAVGIALASDVLASAASAYTYKKNGNIKLKDGLIMMGVVLVMTFISSYFSSMIDTSGMGNAMNVFAILMGVNFIRKNYKKNKAEKEYRHPILISVLLGIMIGFICGFIGAGGGMMILLALTKVLGYDVKTAVGTSVLIMSATAFVGATTHIIAGGTDIVSLMICVVTALIGAQITAKVANKMTIEKSNKIVGVFLIVFGLILTLIKNC